MTKKVILVIAICAVCALLVVGCSRNTTSPTPTNTPLTSPLSITSPSISPLTTNTPGMANPSAFPTTTASPDQNSLNPSSTLGSADAAEVADKIKSEVNKLSEISSAAVVVEGETALVGVKYDSAYKGNMTTRISDMIKEKAMSVDPNLKDVVVTDDQTMMDEIEDMRANMTGGTLAGDIKAKFDSMLNRLKPQA